MLIRVSILLIFIGSNISLSYAGLFGDSQAREQVGSLSMQVNEMETRVTKMEEMLKSQALLGLYTQVETLGSELGKLRGQVEVLTNQNEALQKRQRDFYVDLDNRLRHIEDPNAPPAMESSSLPVESEVSSSDHPAPAAAIESSPVASNEPANATQNNAYEAAYNTFRNGDYNEAIAQFEAYLAKYPTSVLAPGAAYWVGNAHYALRDFQQAINTQRKLISTYPDSNKVPDALLNIASSQLELADRAAAKATLEDLVEKHPISEAAKKAKLRLANF